MNSELELLLPKSKIKLIYKEIRKIADEFLDDYKLKKPKIEETSKEKISRFTGKKTIILTKSVQIKLKNFLYKSKEFDTKIVITAKIKTKTNQDDGLIEESTQFKVKFHFGMLYLEKEDYEKLSSRERTEISLRIKKELQEPELPKLNIQISIEDKFNIKITNFMEARNIKNIPLIVRKYLIKLLTIEILPKLSYYHNMSDEL